MKQVLIAIDYDPTAEEIAKAGHDMARSMNANVTLLHVVADYTYYSSLEYSPVMGFDSFVNFGTPQPGAIEDLHEAAKAYLEKTKEYLNDDTVHILVKDGDTGDAVLEAAKEIQAGIVVLGTHSRRGLEKILMGSVAEKVLRHSEIPLYIIPIKSGKEK